jgi:anthranilate/para-aminobenzoate synthase component II
MPFVATRYHSLVLEKISVPDDFRITAWCGVSADSKSNALSQSMLEQEEVMAIEHNTLPIFGVQFHPESLLTKFGHHILNNFINSQNISNSLSNNVEI